MPSIFTKIINGEIPCYKIMEDEFTIAFLTIQPIHLGHTLVVPKIEIDHHLDCPEPYYSRVFINAQKIGKAIMKATNCKRIGTCIIGLEVPHFHYHLMPIWSPEDMDFRRAKSRSEKEMKEIREKICSYL
ncbi:MAG: HIT family protein [Bdellovibrio sp.]|nr:HIT family protein [Bdellovibrio sp.]